MSVLSQISKEINTKSDKAFSIVVRLIGPGFIVVMWALVGYFTFFYFYVMAGVMNMRFPIWFSFPYHGLIGYTFFGVLFNHLLACIVKPGDYKTLLSDIQRMKDLKLHNKSNSNEKLIKDHFGDKKLSLEMDHLIKYRFRPIPSFEENYAFYGVTCKETKLLLSHHCNICNTGIIMRDHHGPWINNCIGMHNGRYFLLFLFYVLGGGLEAILPVYVTMKTPPFGDEHYAILVSSLTMSMVLGGIMVGFNAYTFVKIANIWNMGDPTLEFWKEKAKSMGISLYDSKDPEHMKFQGIRDNIFKTFGTRSFFEMFLPSIRDLPFFGHEWTLEAMELDAEMAAIDKQQEAEIDEYVL